jgi:hypothetical protein
VLLDRNALGERLIRGELLARGLRARLGGGERGLGDRDLGGDVVELFLADGTGGDQRRAPGNVFLGPRQVGLRPCQIGFAGRDLRPQRPVVDEQGARLTHRLGELGLRLLERDPRVGRVEADQHLAGLDEIGVIGGDGDDRTRDLRRELDDVALDVGVVGGLVVIEHQRPVGAVGDGGEQDHAGDAEQRLLAPRVAGRRRGDDRGGRGRSPAAARPGRGRVGGRRV